MLGGVINFFITPLHLYSYFFLRQFLGESNFIREEMASFPIFRLLHFLHHPDLHINWILSHMCFLVSPTVVLRVWLFQLSNDFPQISYFVFLTACFIEILCFGALFQYHYIPKLTNDVNLIVLRNLSSHPDVNHRFSLTSLSNNTVDCFYLGSTLTFIFTLLDDWLDDLDIVESFLSRLLLLLQTSCVSPNFHKRTSKAVFILTRWSNG